jgi:hypothetical protein
MSIFLISLDKNLTADLLLQLRENCTMDIECITPDSKEIKYSVAKPELVIIVSNKNETWTWWIIGELLFKFPRAFYIILHADEKFTDEKRISPGISSVFCKPGLFFEKVIPHLSALKQDDALIEQNRNSEKK